MHGGDPLASKQARARRRDRGRHARRLSAYRRRSLTRLTVTQTHRPWADRAAPSPAARQEGTPTSLTRTDVRRAFAAIRDGKTAVDVKTAPARPRPRPWRPGRRPRWRSSVLVDRLQLGDPRPSCVKGSKPVQAYQTCGPVGTRDAILENAADYDGLFKTLRQDGSTSLRDPATGRRRNPADRT